MARKALFITLTLLIILSILYALDQSRRKTLDRADINLVSEGFYVDSNFFEFQAPANDVISFMKNSFGSYIEDSGWQEYVEKAGICPSDTVRIVTYGNLDLLFMKQGDSEIFAAWILSQNNKPSLKGDMLVESNFTLGTSYDDMLNSYKDRLTVTTDDVKGQVFSIESSTGFQRNSDDIFPDLPSPVPVSGNFGRSSSVNKVESGFLCIS